MQYSKDAKVRSFVILIAIFKVWRIIDAAMYIFPPYALAALELIIFKLLLFVIIAFFLRDAKLPLISYRETILEWHLRLDHLRSARCVYLAYHGSLGWWTRSPFSYGDRHFSNPCRLSSERTFSSTLDLAAEVFCSSRTTKEIKTKF